MTDQLISLLSRQFTELLASNASDIAQKARTAEDGKHSVSFGFKLTVTRERLFSTGKVSHAQRYQEESQDSIEIVDPTQPKLPTFEKR